MRMTEKQQFISIKNQYRAAHGNAPAATHQILAWAEEQGIYQLDTAKARARDAAKLSDAMRTEYTTVDGQRVRVNHCYKSGQQELWDSMATIARDSMTLSLAMRRRNAAGETKQMRRDEIAWDRVHADQAPLQLGLGFYNFTNDLIEAGLVSAAASSTAPAPHGEPPRPAPRGSSRRRERAPHAYRPPSRAVPLRDSSPPSRPEGES